LFLVAVSLFVRYKIAPKEQVATEEQIAQTRTDIEAITQLTLEDKIRLEKEREILSSLTETEDITVPDIEIKITENKKTIINNGQGYTLTVPNNLIIARSVLGDWIELHDKIYMCKGDPKCPPIIHIRVTKNNPLSLSIDKWLEKAEQEIGDKIYSPREKMTIGDIIAYKVSVAIQGTFDGFYYYLTNGQKIYSIRISKIDDKKYIDNIKTFLFLSVQ